MHPRRVVLLSTLLLRPGTPANPCKENKRLQYCHTQCSILLKTKGFGAREDAPRQTLDTGSAFVKGV